MQIRTDPPAEVCRPNPAAILYYEKYLVCRRNASKEIIVQSDRDPDRAQHSVDVLNEHEEMNGRQPLYYWRPRKESE